ncbi:hypothetical protein ACFZ8E_25700 [Methylobacterium sp. HMF5984]|uniref:hypothetical protein n=1 Tax=Methylobacterium sp. HMF5984 TaxID=3367370 RepID=UPI003852AF65
MSYAQHKANWEVFQADTQKVIAKTREAHHVTARDLVKELALLVRVTGDNRFSAALEALQENRLTDENDGWIRKWTKEGSYDPALVFVEFIDEEIAKGRSLREVCAQIVADCVLMHATFEAGVAHVERIWRRAKADPLDIE